VTTAATTFPNDARSDGNTASALPNRYAFGSNDVEDHAPGAADVSTIEPGQPFYATPNFSMYGGGSCVPRPCWLPLYPTPQLMPGTAVTRDFPYEALGSDPGNRVLVLCQVEAGQGLSEADQQAQGYRVRNGVPTPGSVHFDSGGIYESSNVWDVIALPADQLSQLGAPALMADAGLEPVSGKPGWVYAYGADLWLGNTGLHGPTRCPAMQ
jgi:hypothetical protein